MHGSRNENEVRVGCLDKHLFPVVPVHGGGVDGNCMVANRAYRLAFVVKTESETTFDELNRFVPLRNG